MRKLHHRSHSSLYGWLLTYLLLVLITHELVTYGVDDVGISTDELVVKGYSFDFVVSCA